MTLPDDLALLTRMALGDEEALRLLYERFRPRLRRYLWHQLDGDLGRVEDLLQEIFLAAWRGAATYRGMAQVATWLFQIAHHHVLHAAISCRISAPAPRARPARRRGTTPGGVRLMPGGTGAVAGHRRGVASPRGTVGGRHSGKKRMAGIAAEPRTARNHRG